MELSVKARNLELNESTETAIARKLNRLARRLQDIGEAKVEFRRVATRSKGDAIVAQITLDVKGTLLRSEERSGTLPTAFDLIVKALEPQVERYKGTHYRSLAGRRSGRTRSIRTAQAPEEFPPPRGGRSGGGVHPNGEGGAREALPHEAHVGG